MTPGGDGRLDPVGAFISRVAVPISEAPGGPLADLTFAVKDIIDKLGGPQGARAGVGSGVAGPRGRQLGLDAVLGGADPGSLLGGHAGALGASWRARRFSRGCLVRLVRPAVCPTFR